MSNASEHAEIKERQEKKRKEKEKVILSLY
jgi:hypothetical protein